MTPIAAPVPPVSNENKEKLVFFDTTLRDGEQVSTT